jgi:hypothetical protein
LNLEGVELKVLKTLDWEKIAVKVSYSLWSWRYKEVLFEQG